MAKDIQAIQRRIETIDDTTKITNAMKLVSMSRVQKYRRLMNELTDFVDRLDRFPNEEVDDELPKLMVVFMPDLGLSSAYNQQVWRGVKNSGIENVIWVGTKFYERAVKDDDINVLSHFETSDDLNIDDLYKEISEFINDYHLVMLVPELDVQDVTITYESLMARLPIQDSIIYEPNISDVNQQYQSIRTLSLLYHGFYQAKYVEYFSRRVAMDAATDNANDLREELENEYNKARQEKITNEILELSQGA